MFLLAHLGITVAILYVVERRFLKEDVGRLDYRLILVGAILPDIIDKPFALFGLGGGRAIGHTLLFAVVLTLIVVILGQRRGRMWAALGLAFGVWLHLALDGMWGVPAVLLWPAYGLSFPLPHPMDLWSLLVSLLTNPVLLGEEFVGGVMLLGLVMWKKVYTLPSLRRFLTTGTID